MSTSRLRPGPRRTWIVATGIIVSLFVAWFWQNKAHSVTTIPLQRDLTDPASLRTLANQEARSGKRRQAIADFEHLITLSPHDADSWQALGLLYIGDHQYARSLDALSRAATLAPNDQLTQRTLGIMAMHFGRLDQAKHALQEVVMRQPDDSEALAALAQVTMRMDASPAGLTAAEQQIDKALEMRPSSTGYNTRGQIHMAQRRFKAAIQDLELAVKFEPRGESNYLLLSQCYASAGEPEKALKAAAEYQRRSTAHATRMKSSERSEDAGH